MTTGEIDARRRARLRDELLDAGLPVPDGPAGELLVDELAYARWAGVHEHRRFGYGSVLNPRDVAAVGDLLGSVDPDAGQAGLSELRRYADGRRTFVVRSPERPPLLVRREVADELELVYMHRRTGGTVVRRIDGGMQVVADDGTVGHYTGRWSLRPSLGDAVHAVGDRVRLRDRDVLCRILDLCLHVLSPRHVGATLVWRLEGAGDDVMTRQPMPGPIALSVVDDRHLDAVAKRVGMLDGACVVERDGAVSGFGAFLSWDPSTEEKIAHEAGLRHTSARWYSHDVPGALVFVVSEDGPLTVYAAGSEVLSSATGGADRTGATLA